MASVRCSRVVVGVVRDSVRHIQTGTLSQTSRNASVRVRLVATTAGSAVVAYVAYKTFATPTPPTSTVSAAAKNCSPAQPTKSLGARLREMTFLNFASIEYDGNVYMTPADFLQSIVDDKPRLRAERRRVREVEIERWLRATPSKSKDSSQLFRTISDKGIISYTEYLFLLCVLTKPKSGFKIAFNMFDTDGDQRVDKKEFLVLERLMTHVHSSSRCSPSLTDELMRLYGGIFSQKDSDQLSLIADTDSVKSSDESPNPAAAAAASQSSGRLNLWSLLRSEFTDDDMAPDDVPVETTLTTHFFGSRGKDVLNYEDFHRFMENLQTEVLEMEFNECSHGTSTIHEQDFARILLRYTILTAHAHEQYLDRLARRIPHSQGITFGDFKEFCQFLNNLDDFTLAMRIYTYANQPISEGEFRRAVRACTGQTLNSHVVHVVFQLFDIDGDGKLSHKEFVAVMKDRLLRGTKVSDQKAWDSYKSCLKSEIRNG